MAARTGRVEKVTSELHRSVAGYDKAGFRFRPFSPRFAQTARHVRHRAALGRRVAAGPRRFPQAAWLRRCRG